MPDPPFAPVTLAPGIVVEERAQHAGECVGSGAAHMFVLQSRPVPRAQPHWEGRRREGPMRAGDVSVLPAGLELAWRWEARVQSLHVSVDPRVGAALVEGVALNAGGEVFAEGEDVATVTDAGTLDRFMIFATPVDAR